MLNKYLLPAITIALLATNAFAQSKTAEQLIGSCARCHGEDGNASGQYPSLAGQQAAYTAKQIRDFKSKARKSGQMAPMVGVLTEDNIQVLAEYYAGEFLKRARFDKELAAEGEKIAAELNCASCHQKNYRGVELIPRLSRQNRVYLANQMKLFRDGKRTNDNGLKTEFMSDLTDEQIKLLSHFFAGK